MDINLVEAMVKEMKYQMQQTLKLITHLEQALVAGTPEEVPRAGIVTGNIPVVKGSDMEGEGGEEIAKLSIHDSILKGDEA